MKKFDYKSVMQTPRLTKICLNRGVNGAVADKKLVDIAVEELTTITGQKAVSTMSARKISPTSNCVKACQSVHVLPSGSKDV